MNSENLRKIRIRSGLSQKQTAIQLGISQQRYNQYETGRREPDNETLNLLADYFNVSADYLLGKVSAISPSMQKKPPTIEEALEGVGITDPENVAAIKRITDLMAKTECNTEFADELLGQEFGKK